VYYGRRLPFTTSINSWPFVQLNAEVCETFFYYGIQSLNPKARYNDHQHYYLEAENVLIIYFPACHYISLVSLWHKSKVPFFVPTTDFYYVRDETQTFGHRIP